jgi:hypothetical protein
MEVAGRRTRGVRGRGKSAVGDNFAGSSSVSGRSLASWSKTRSSASVAMMRGPIGVVTMAKWLPEGNGWRESPTAKS